MEYGLSTTQVAVIIATKNRPDLLKQRALDSVLKQSKSPKYLIVVDDSSEQAKQQNRLIVESLSSNDYHTQYLQNQRTCGASGAWNTAIDYLVSQQIQSSNSLFLAFLDDDDEWHPNYLESCSEAVSEKHCNMVATGFFRYESNREQPIECLPPHSLDEDLFLRGNPGIQGSNLFLSLDMMMMAGGFDEHLLSCTDRDLCIRLSELGNICYYSINEPMLNHYAESDRQRLSTPNSPAKKKGLEAFWLKYYGRMNDEQREAFLERAKSLFNWQPESALQIVSHTTYQTALTLGIELGNISLIKLRQTIARLSQVGIKHLVGFNLVLTAVRDVNLNDLCVFLEFVGQQGITCYNLCGKYTCIERATVFVANENLGHSAWVLNGLQPDTQPIDKKGNAVSAILTEVGAHKLRADNFDEQQIELEKKYSSVVLTLLILA